MIRMKAAKNGQVVLVVVLHVTKMDIMHEDYNTVFLGSNPLPRQV